MKPLTKPEPLEHISFQFKTLQLLGLWFYIPHDFNCLKFWLHIMCKVFTGIFVFIIPPLGQSICLIKLILSRDAEIQEIAGIINLVLTEMLTSLKLLDLRCRRSLLKELKEQMEGSEFLHFHRPQIDFIEKSIKVSKKLFVWLTIGVVIDITVHIIIVPAVHRFQFLPVKMDFIFFDIYKYPYFDIIFIYQILYKPTLLLTFVAIQTLRWGFLLCTISQLDVLIYNLKGMKKLDEGENLLDHESFDEAFKRNVIHHCAIIKFVKTFEAAFGGQFLLFFIFNSCIIGTTAIEFFSIQNPLNHVVDIFWIFGFVFMMIIILFIDCYFGSIITEKNSYISTVVYCHPWINLPKNTKKNLIIFISRNQQTLTINAAKLVPVSLTTFTKVMNWTYKCFALLNQMKD
ncbi:odorant receptor 23a-like [Vanessa atalanta]|uniref:odorant receptor 23a-like n=1 Tax=Vanessa atalanta TaxID=42275 RepID=UPI001FCD679F|nr:odorant receptor 23a-like [Vanessa atalanta]